MIVTVTLNPALHVRYQAEQVSLRADNEISQVSYRAGGQGLAVARVLHAFGHDVLAAGLAGGATGELIRTDLARSGVPTRFTSIGRESRRVIEVTDAAGGATRFAEPAPFITTEEVGRLAADYRGLLSGAVAVVLSGTLPAGLPPEIYGTLATYAADAGVPAVIDAGGTALRHGVTRRPALVIPGLDGARPGPAGPEVAGRDAVRGMGKDAAGLDAVRLHGAPGAAAPGAAGLGAAGLGGAGLDVVGLVADGVGAVVTVMASEVWATTAEGQWRAAPAAGTSHPGASGASGEVGGSGKAGGPGDAGGSGKAGGPRDAGGAALAGEPGSREALVAGLIPGLVFGWSWPDRLRHAVALAAATGPSGDVDLERYERLLPAVAVWRS